MRSTVLFGTGLLLAACQGPPASGSVKAGEVGSAASAGAAPAAAVASLPPGRASTSAAPRPAPLASTHPASEGDAAGPPAAGLVGDGGQAVPIGGNWLRCYASFQPRNSPQLDVMRLALMCGPSNGMHKVTSAPLAQLQEGGAKREHKWRASAGDCYRIFAVGSPGISDLDVEVLDSAGARIAFDTSDDRWPIVKADGAFCVFRDGDYRAVVSAQRGAGSYAIEIWRLR